VAKTKQVKPGKEIPSKNVQKIKGKVSEKKKKVAKDAPEEKASVSSTGVDMPESYATEAEESSALLPATANTEAEARRLICKAAEEAKIEEKPPVAKRVVAPSPPARPRPEMPGQKQAATCQWPVGGSKDLGRTLVCDKPLEPGDERFCKVHRAMVDAYKKTAMQ
jgi:hypothetical protein